MTFSKSMFKPNTTATLKDAELRLIEEGFSNFTFKNSSIANGASFYFVSEKGEEIRVSDHRLTGKRAYSTIQVDLVVRKELEKTLVTKEAAKLEVGSEITHSKYGKGVVMQGNVTSCIAKFDCGLRIFNPSK